MSSQMPPPQGPPSRPYSPYQQQMAHSPPGIALPPAKRQRLSPGISSPQNIKSELPESPYGYNPYSAASPPSFNTPQAYSTSPPPAQGAMGPPPRPKAEKAEKEEKERITDITDISDAIFGSGVDLREEENYLSNTFRNMHSQQSGKSFDSGTTIASPNNSFGSLANRSFGAHGAFSGSGPISQGTQSQESIEQEINRKHQEAAKAYAKQHEQHLRDPFLLGNNTRHRMHRIAENEGVRLDIHGLWDKTNNVSAVPKQPQNVSVSTRMGPDGTGVADVKAQSVGEAVSHALLDETSKYAEILSLLSLAANERIRDLLDETYKIARGRRYGSHGVVQPDFQDIATGERKASSSVKPESLTGTSWDQSRTTPKDESSPNESQPTVSFTSSINSHLQHLAISDRDAESARVKRRQDRARNLEAAEKAFAEGTGPAPSQATPTSTPAADGTVTAPGSNPSSMPATPAATDNLVAPEKPMTKKERERLAKAGQTEEVLHKNANVTAAMAMGLGKKKNKYSWMTGGGIGGGSSGGSGAGGGSGGTNPFARPAGGKSSSNKGDRKDGGEINGVDGGAGRDGRRGEKVDRAMQVRERKWGSWREDGIEGRGIQLRDWAMVVERDGRERKGLQRCLLDLGREESERREGSGSGATGLTNGHKEEGGAR